MRASQALLALCAAAFQSFLPCLGLNPGDSLVSGTSVGFVSTPSGATFAVRNYTMSAGKLLVDGTKNLQPDLTACAESCSRHDGCTSFQWCGEMDGCVVDPWGSFHNRGFCQLEEAFLALSVAVFQLASDNPLFATAGLRMAIDDPGPLSGYIELFGRSLLGQDEFTCNETLLDGKCFRNMPLQEAQAECTSNPKCQAIIHAPRGLSQLKYAGKMSALKSTGTGGPIDMATSVVAPCCALYVKDGQLLMESPATGTECSSTLPAGAIAGIAVAAASACLAALFSGMQLWHRCKRLPCRSFSGSRKTAIEADSMENVELDGAQEAPAGEGVSTSINLARDDTEQALLSPLFMSGLTEQSFGSSITEFCIPGLGMKAPALDLVTLGPRRKEQIMVPQEEIEFCKDQQGNSLRLGGGSSGDVYRAVLRGTTSCAVKVFKFGSHPHARQHFMHEVEMLCALDHPHIIGAVGAAVRESEGMLLMQLMPGGDLASRMHMQLPNEKGRLFAWRNKGHRVALQVASGLAYMHKHRIAHMDLKPRNVLLSREADAKIGDVGFSRMMSGDYLSNLDSRLGTWEWCAPELLLGQKAGLQADIYSYGVFLWELCTGEPPRRGCLRPLEAPGDCPAEVAELGQRCLAADPEERPTVEEVVKVLNSARRAAKAQPSNAPPPKAGDSATSVPRAAPRMSLDLRTAVPRMSLDKGSFMRIDTPRHMLRRVSIMTCQSSSPFVASHPQETAFLAGASIFRSALYQPGANSSSFGVQAARNEPTLAPIAPAQPM